MASESRNTPLRPPTKWTRPVTLIDAQATTGVSSVGPISLGAPTAAFTLFAYRATTSLASASTRVSYRLQGSLDGSVWHTLGAATRAIIVRSSAPTLTGVASTAAVCFVRGRINLFTTSNASTLAGSDKVAATVKILPA